MKYINAHCKRVLEQIDFSQNGEILNHSKKKYNLCKVRKQI